MPVRRFLAEPDIEERAGKGRIVDLAYLCAVAIEDRFTI